MRADLQAKWSELLRQIAAARAQYGALTPEQQAAVNNAVLPEVHRAGISQTDLPVGVASEAGLQDVIWRGTYYTPAGPQASGYGHFDHVHITTTPSN